MKITIEVPDNVEAFGAALENFLLVVDKQLSDGFQITDDVPPIVAGALATLVPAMTSMKKAAQEVKAEPFAAAKSISIHVANVVEAFLTKPVKDVTPVATVNVAVEAPKA